MIRANNRHRFGGVFFLAESLVENRVSIATNRAAEENEITHVEPQIAALEFGNVGLGSLGSFGDVGLTQTSGETLPLQYLPEPAMPLRVDFIPHISAENQRTPDS